MTIFARNPDTGVAAWAYQMTPFDEWDYDGINEMILVDNFDIKGEKRNVLVHFDRNGLAYTLDRKTGIPLVVEKFDPKVNWTTGVDLDPKSARYGRPTVVASKSPFKGGEDVNTKGICPAALGSKDEQPASYSPLTGLFYVPTNHVCMDYEPFKVSYTAGQPYVGATLSMFPAPDSHGGMGNFIAWMPAKVRSSGRTRSHFLSGLASSPRLAGSPATARSKATSSVTIRKTARTFINSRRHLASSATCSPTPIRASNTSASSQASVVGPASVSPLV